MRVTVARRGFVGVISAAALGLVLSGGALAQGTPPGGDSKSGANEAADKLKDVKITLIVDQENLLQTIRTLMKSAKADFRIDDELNAGKVTVHFRDLPFKDALATIVKVSTLPIAYELKDGIYHFKLRIDPPVVEKPVDTVKPAPQARTGRLPVNELTSDAALRKLTGAYDTPPPTLFYHSTQPISHGSTSSFGLNGSGRFQSNSTRQNPDGSVSRSGNPGINLFGLLRGLLGR